ncbi:MAG: D-glycerate dehydrogenase [Vicinamibacterales bacterium]
MRPSVLLTKRVPSAVHAKLEAACDVDLNRSDGKLSRDELLARVAGKHGLVCLLTDRIDRDVIAAGRDLKVIANIAVGYDNIDIAAARERGIVVTNTPGVLTDAVAEFTWALILGITRRVGEGERLTRANQWKGWALDFLLGTQLTGKQLGIVGMGAIGRSVAAKAAAFGMRVAYIARDGRAQGRVEPPGATAEDAYEPMGFDKLLVTSDVLSLHCPLTPETRHLIDRKSLARMKRTAYLVNTTRGPVVDEDGLVWALEQRLIAGAALDVFEEEPTIHPGLFALENVLLAPHIGSATVETRTAMADLAVSNALAVLAGRPPLTPVG